MPSFVARLHRLVVAVAQTLLVTSVLSGALRLAAGGGERRITVALARRFGGAAGARQRSRLRCVDRIVARLVAPGIAAVTMVGPLAVLSGTVAMAGVAGRVIFLLHAHLHGDRVLLRWYATVPAVD